MSEEESLTFWRAVYPNASEWYIKQIVKLLEGVDPKKTAPDMRKHKIYGKKAEIIIFDDFIP